jgi:hypothetical protein
MSPRILTLLGLLLVMLVPVVFIVPVLWLANRLERFRHEVRARQVAVTDAIHRRLGAIVSPTVRKRPWGPWEVLIPVPFTRPAVLGEVLAIARAALAPVDGVRAERFQIVLVPQEEGGRRGR